MYSTGGSKNPKRDSWLAFLFLFFQLLTELGFQQGSSHVPERKEASIARPTASCRVANVKALLALQGPPEGGHRDLWKSTRSRLARLPAGPDWALPGRRDRDKKSWRDRSWDECFFSRCRSRMTL